MAQTDQRFEQLKQKYQPVVNAIGQHRVRLQNLNMQGNKLYMRAEASSDEAKNRIWDAVKLIDPNYSDLICDITVNASLQQGQSQDQAQKTQTAGASVSGGQGTRNYTVQPGDSLSKISKQFYGDENHYMKIFEANRDKLKDPNQIRPGQELRVPE